MDIGRLDKRITVQGKSTALDEFGQEVNSWTDIKTIWAEIRPITSREKLRVGTIAWELSHTIRIRFDSALMPLKTLATRRVKFEDRYLSISSALDFDERHKYLILECIEGGPDG